MITQTIGSVTFSLKEPFDFSFLREYGEPFAVFDQQDSGNLCFGVCANDQKLFLKIAGAATLRATVTPEEAIQRMRQTAQIYRDLAHKSLTRLVAEEAIPGGLLLCFEWFDGLCMGKQYDSHRVFAALPLENLLSVFRDVLCFHEHVHEKGYVAVDFYDGAILYSPEKNQTMICDIELYQRKPMVNTMGRMWGSSRFMSPEECTLGAAIDERSNVFCMGATAFQLLGGGMERAIEKWRADAALHAVAAKAVRERPEDRYPTIAKMRHAWDAATAWEGSNQ